MNHLTRTLALELGPLDIRVNAVAPGATRTDIGDQIIRARGEKNFVAVTPLGRVGEPSDVAHTVCWLASEATHWVTSQLVEASGGMTL